MSKEHKVHLWKRWNREQVLCVRCGIVRKVYWTFDPEEVGS